MVMKQSKASLRRTGAVAAASIAAAALLMSAEPALAQQGKIKVGMMLPYTGTYAALGTAITNGFKLAIAEKRRQARRARDRILHR
jgi:branched-chain amino acid transport system substrate-binding protein